MSDLFRPEALAALWRLRGVGAALLLLSPGLWWLGLGTGLLRWIGALLAVAGLAMLWAAVQRLRFRPGHDGPGVVEIVEGQITYLGPGGGGFAALSEITALSLARRGHDRAWVIAQEGRPELVIPTGAEGAEALFDLFGSLPGLTGEALIAALERPEPAKSTLPARWSDRPDLRQVWRRPPPGPRLR